MIAPADRTRIALLTVALLAACTGPAPPPPAPAKAAVLDHRE